jgi:Bacterial pre-peptidase C-terminal domain
MDEDELLLDEDDSLEGIDDEDVFEVDLEEGVAYEVATIGDEFQDLVVEVFDEDGELLFDDDNSVFGPDPYLQFVAPEDGTYEIVVSDIEDETGDYSILMGESDAPLIA